MEEFDIFEITLKSVAKGFSDNKICRCYANKHKKTLSLYYGKERVIIRCDKDDEYDVMIGLGLAISNLFDTKKHREHREHFRNKRTGLLNYKKYSQWVVQDFFNSDLIKIRKVKTLLENLDIDQCLLFSLRGGVYCGN